MSAISATSTSGVVSHVSSILYKETMSTCEGNLVVVSLSGGAPAGSVTLPVALSCVLILAIETATRGVVMTVA